MMKTRYLGIQPYHTVWKEMQQFTISRTPSTEDECWLLEHFPVYTQGQAGKAEHIFNPGAIPTIQSDRGGQVTYHGPGQLVAYVLFDLKRKNLGIKNFVSSLENLLIHLLSNYGITAHKQCKAPGVYVENKKIASIGLRVKNGCTYHGIALNVAMDLSPFLGINPCGFSQLQMTQMRDLVAEVTISDVTNRLKNLFLTQFEN